MSSASYRVLGLSVPVTEALDPKLWRERYAGGIALGGTKRLTLAERVAAAKAGTSAGDLIDSIPDDVIKWHLRAAMSELEVKLGIPMGIEVVKTVPLDEGLIKGQHYDHLKPRLPYTHGEALTWFRIDLPPNVISIERIRAFYFDRLVWNFEGDTLDQVLLEWPKAGVLHIIPRDLESVIVTSGSMGSGNYGIWETINLHHSPVPDFWAVDYTRGPVSRDGKVGHIEAVLAHWVYATAGILLLSQAGLAQSKGLTSTSISMDGVSRSISLQASAIYGINSALENAYEKAAKRIDWKQLRASKRGLRMYMFSH